MNKYVQLAEKSINNFLEEGTYLSTYDESFVDLHQGIMVKVSLGENLKGFTGSIYPTRKDEGLDIIYESVKAAFDTYKYPPISSQNLGEMKVTVYEFYQLQKISYLEDFGDFDGICLSYQGKNFLSFREDFRSSQEMFEDAISQANLDSFDIFSIIKFKVKIYEEGVNA